MDAMLLLFFVIVSSEPLPLLVNRSIIFAFTAPLALPSQFCPLSRYLSLLHFFYLRVNSLLKKATS